MSEIRVGVIGGSGLAGAFSTPGESKTHAVDTPFGRPSDSIIETEWHGLPVFLLARHGPGHTLAPGKVPYRANLFALKALGVTHVFATGAVGSLREEFKPRDLVVIDQLIDKTARPATFYDRAAVHVEFAEPFCPLLREVLLEAAGAEAPARVHDGGCYVVMEGPAFSTRAESLMHRLWGGDLIGMTALPEARLAREAEMAYGSVALVTDFDAWKSKPPKKFDPAAAPHDAAAGTSAATPDTLLEEIRSNLGAASESAGKLLKKAVELLAERRDRAFDSAAHTALERAIWSDKSAIAVEEVERLAPLWLKYFPK